MVQSCICVIIIHREEFPNISYFKECRVVGGPEAAASGDLEGDDGLWAPPERRERYTPRNPRQEQEQSWAVPEAIRGEVPRKRAELTREGGSTSGDRVFFSFALVFLAVALGAVCAVWKKGKKGSRLES